MTAVASAIAATAVIGAGSAYLAGKEQSKAAGKATAAEERIADKNLELQRELTAQQREDFLPWRDVGEQALDRIWQGVQSGEFEVGDVDVTKDPGYEFRMSEGIKALDKSASARGRLLSGAHKKALTRYSQGLASQEYANAYARERDKLGRRFNILSGLSGGGQASAARQAGATSQLAGTSGNILSNLGTSQARGELLKGDATAGAYRGMAESANKGAQNYLLYKALA